MDDFTLTPEALQELRAAHRSAKREKKVGAAYKINSVILLGTGWTFQEVSEALLLDEDTLSSYVKKYQSDGFGGLLKTYHKGSNKKLTADQLSTLHDELDSSIHLTTRSICQFVKSTFDVSYTTGGMTDLLHNLGYVYKKPKLVPTNPDIDAQEQFLEQYNDFMANKPENEAVFFVDAVHPVHNSMPAHGWIKKGVTKELNSNSGRSRLNIHGAMNAETFETTVIAGEENVNTDSTIQLFEHLEELYPLAVVIHVILDNAKYHYSKAVQDYVASSRIHLIFQPAYSPELNLIERLWRLFKKNVLYNKYYADFSKFKKGCLDFFKNQENHYEEIQSIMGEGLSALI